MPRIWQRLPASVRLAGTFALAPVGALEPTALVTAQVAPARVEVAVPTCLKLRATAGRTAAPLDCLAPGTRALAVTAGPEWTRLRLADGREGWAASRYLRSVEPSAGVASGETEAEPQQARPSAADLALLAPFEPLSPGLPVVRRGTFRQRTLLTGELRAVRATPIAVPQTSAGRLEVRWLAEDGEVIQAGDRLAEFDTTSLLSELEDLRLSTVETADQLVRAGIEAERSLAESSLAAERARLELQKAEIAAQVPEGLLARREHQERQLTRLRAQVAHEKAREELAAQREANRADLALRRLDLEKAQRRMAELTRDLEALVVTAPGNGLVLVERHPWEGRKFDAGDTVWPGMTLLTLPDLDAFEVEAQLSDVDDGKIEVGRRALCRLDAYPDEAIGCSVEEISPVAQAPSPRSQRRAFRVRLALASSDAQRMRPGMSVRIEVESHRLEQALLVPRQGLDLSTQPPRALLAAGGGVEVELGPCNAFECVVARGLEEGAALRPIEGVSP